MKETEKILKALANRRRLAIVKYISRVQATSVGDIAQEIKLSFKSTSRHLSVLRSADVLDREQINLTAIYTLTRPINAILKLILSIL